MANFDAPDLLARAKRLAQRPSTDEDMADADWYLFLGEGQDEVTRMIATYDPSAVCGVPTQLTTADSGYTYTFPTASTLPPLVIVELTDGKGGTAMIVGSYDSDVADVVWEGNTIRMARNSPRTFANGLWARWVTVGGSLDGSNAPTIPLQFRHLLPSMACIKYATRGGYRDPAPYKEEFNRLWGDTLMTLRKRQFQSRSTGAGVWYRGSDLG